MSILGKKFIFFLIILTVILIIVGYFSYQGNLYSKEVLKLEILGPAETELSQEVEYIVKYKNNGDIRLENPELIFEYPENSLPLEGNSIREVRGEKQLGDAIYPGEERTISFKARLFGKENQLKTARASLSYRPKNLKAFYESSTTFTTVIKKVPISFEFDLPSKIESGKDVQLGLIYYSNLNYPLSDLRVKINYPSGFEFVKSEPLGLEKNEWEVPLLNRNQGGRVNVEGKLSGKVGENKVFEAKLGIWQGGEFVLLKEINWGLEIVRPSLYISQQINGSPEYIAWPGDSLHYQIFFRNVGDKDLNNLFLMVKLEGKAFDMTSLKSDKGDFELGDNSLIFDWRRNPDLRFLPAKEEGEVEFWINLKEDWEIQGELDKNSVIKDRVYLSQIWQNFETKINSKLEVVQKGYFKDEVFGNFGSVPPQVGKETSYTIMWQAKNYYNDVENVKVKALLPKNVDLTGEIFPEEEIKNFAFDSESREIVWTLGEMGMGEGILSSPQNISFQVSLMPLPEDRGRVLEIISNAKIKGEDKWTNQILESETDAIDTTLPDDESVDEEQGIVQ